MIRLIAIITILCTASAVAYGAPLRLGIVGKIESMNPLLSKNPNDSLVHALVLRPLVKVNADWRYVCELCEEIPSMAAGSVRIMGQGSTKQLVSTWKIKADARWGDGQPLTGKDIKKSWEIGQSLAATDLTFYQRIADIKVDEKNPRKFTITHSEVRYDFYQIRFPILPAHVEGVIFEKGPSSYKKNTGYLSNPRNPALYNGPFLPTEVNRSQKIVFGRNPHFSDKKQEGIAVQIYPTAEALEEALIFGSVDILPPHQIPTPKLAKLVQHQTIQNSFRVIRSQSGIYEHIDINLRNPILASPQVRRAFKLAIDKEALAGALEFAGKTPAKSLFPAKDTQFHTDLPANDFDLKEANRLLDQAGWTKRNKAGFRIKGVKELEVELVTTAGNEARVQMAEQIKKSWEALGARTVVQYHKPEQFFGDTVKKARYRGFALFAWVVEPDTPPRASLHSEEIPKVDTGYNGQNSGSWNNKDADALLDRVFTEFEASKRREMMAELQSHYMTDVPAIPLFHYSQHALSRKSIKGVSLHGLEQPMTLNAEDWVY